MSDKEKIDSIIARLPHLSSYQIDTLDRIINQLRTESSFWRNQYSNVVTDAVLQDFGDALRVHHVFSAEALSKDRFEFALEKVLNGCGIRAQRAPRGNPGHDITVRDERWSLKTQADRNIRKDFIHISKYMEMGRGQWSNNPNDLLGLRDRFFEHMERYERVFTLRRLQDDSQESYELVEIPKSLLSEAAEGQLVMQVDSRQNPKPGYCRVIDKVIGLKFELYFDGGTERKLQVRNLRKDLCTIHATWRFPRREADAVPVFEDPKA